MHEIEVAPAALCTRERPSAHKFSRGLVRAPTASLVRGLTTQPLAPPDLALALAQHARYCDALHSCGLALTHVAPDDAFPDSTFIEDDAIIIEDVAIITRPGAASRRGEIDAIEAALRRMCGSVRRIDAPGTLDGGDVCIAERQCFIGLSRRTNEPGAHQLAAHLMARGIESHFIDIRGSARLLHLKSGLSYLENGTMVIHEDLRTCAELASFRRIEVLPAESYAANCVWINGTVLIAQGFPRLHAALDEAGFSVTALDTSEFRKLDGGLSCLSLRF